MMRRWTAFGPCGSILASAEVDGVPPQRGRTTMAGDEVQAERRLVVGVELGPVYRDHQLRPRTDHETHPGRKQVPQVELPVAEQAVDRFGRMLAVETLGSRETPPDGMNSQCRGFQHPETPFDRDKTVRACRSSSNARSVIARTLRGPTPAALRRPDGSLERVTKELIMPT
jgi:hypothetical protein